MRQSDPAAYPIDRGRFRPGGFAPERFIHALQVRLLCHSLMESLGVE
jgi:hypothetical protein